MKPVKLREGQRGYGVPRLRVALYGAPYCHCVHKAPPARAVSKPV